MCAAQRGKEFIYKKNSKGKLVTRQSRLADPSHGTAIKSFRRAEETSPNCHSNYGEKSPETLVI